MRRLIVSDIHANIEALNGVLKDAGGLYDEIVCCGDLVGYGASPAEVVDWARERVALIVRGNHDRVCAGLEDHGWFNSKAQAAASWTAGQLDRAQLDWLAALPAGPLLEESFVLAHGSPADEDAYLLDYEEVYPLSEMLLRPICFIGHTHFQGAWTWYKDNLYALQGPAANRGEMIHELRPTYQYLINPGSVGQPRDRDPRASYAIWDSDRRELQFRRTAYDVASAQKRIVDAGLPSFLAERLAIGH
jgi:diadenosine tetraphosphatase ApaH/serine/threonine PP2A family protein phosphatase